ncbi:MAG: L-histidine N(alpha)-methyltransferase [Verrucomicrobiota bacterium]
MPDPIIDVHPSAETPAQRAQAIAGLEAGRLDPRLLYATPRQAALWREVAQRHAPIHSNLEFERIYREAFAQLALKMPGHRVRLVGLGCGTGFKEADLYFHLVAAGKRVEFCAVDVSRDLVTEAVGRLQRDWADPQRSLVCDLEEAAFIASWLAGLSENLPRVITFFGLVPNLDPVTVTAIFRAMLRPGDLLAASVHLAPVARTGSLAAAMQAVLPQYDNAETRAWLSVTLEELGLSDRLGPVALRIGEVGGVTAFLGEARWISGEPFELWDHRFTPRAGEPLTVFHSLRYTPEDFERAMAAAGFAATRLALTACGEEGIWSIAPAAA